MRFVSPVSSAVDWGVQVEDRVYSANSIAIDLDAFVRMGGDGLGKLREIAETRNTESFLVEDVKVLAPINRPTKIVAVGQNYMDHCRECNAPIPKLPIVFAKFPSTIVGPYDDILWRREVTDQVDWEVELGVVVGKAARRVPEETALSYVFGYTIIDDVSARDLQEGDGQWVRGKSLDSFCPVGPVIVTADEIADPQGLGIRAYVNGAVMQDSSTAEMIFNVRYLISFLSQAFTLNPGDLIATGTPHGVGVGRTPRVFLHDGDVVEMEIEGIGRLRNTCRVKG
jgi:acylpyruvate hydrolase